MRRWQHADRRAGVTQLFSSGLWRWVAVNSGVFWPPRWPPRGRTRPDSGGR